FFSLRLFLPSRHLPYVLISLLSNAECRVRQEIRTARQPVLPARRSHLFQAGPQSTRRLSSGSRFSPLHTARRSQGCLPPQNIPASIFSSVGRFHPLHHHPSVS